MIYKNKNIALFDFSNVAKRCLFSNHVKISETEIDYDIWRWTVFSSIYYTCFKLKANGCILATDNSSWRKIVYKPYKQNRKILKQKNDEKGVLDIDWDHFYSEMNSFLDKLQQNLPWMILSENGCEADDVIGILSLHDKKNDYTIVSVDQDYKQLLNNKNVKVYDPIKKKYFIKNESLNWVEKYSLKGQVKDNIFNVFTPIDFPYQGVIHNGEQFSFRKPSLSESKIEQILNTGLYKWLEEIGPKEAQEKNKKIELENEKRIKEGLPCKPLLETNLYDRFKINKKILDFNEIPTTLVNRVLDKYKNYDFDRSSDFYVFFKEMGWNGVLENYTQVETNLLKLY